MLCGLLVVVSLGAMQFLLHALRRHCQCDGNPLGSYTLRMVVALSVEAGWAMSARRVQ